MISPEELALIVSGTVSQAGLSIESVSGRKLTRTETERLAEVIAIAMRMVSERSQTRTPPPPFRERRVAMHFNPLKTQELPRITDEDLAQAAKAKQK